MKIRREVGIVTSFKEITVRNSFLIFLGKYPIYVHETWHFRDTHIVKRPKDLEIFEDHNAKIRCLRHLKNSKTQAKAMERINSMGSLIVKGNNKFQEEINYIRSIPEDKRFIVKNMESNEPSDDESEILG